VVKNSNMYLDFARGTRHVTIWHECTRFGVEYFKNGRDMGLMPKDRINDLLKLSQRYRIG